MSPHPPLWQTVLEVVTVGVIAIAVFVGVRLIDGCMNSGAVVLHPTPIAAGR